jgi:hypothetical protein
MPSIHEYTSFVERLELGKFPRPFTTLLDAVKHLQDTLAREGWPTIEEQARARQLLDRLDRIRLLVEAGKQSQAGDTVKT